MVHATLQIHEPNADDVTRIFDRCFTGEFNTELVGGASEPLYTPANDRCARHRIHFTRDYVASALHEVAHWCLAGPRRREIVDYGYWYAPDGRTADQQRAFEQVEVKPQAIEWHFAAACGLGFRVSADNLDANMGPSRAFKQAVAHQARVYASEGLPRRASTFAKALARCYGRAFPFGPEHFNEQSL